MKVTVAAPAKINLTLEVTGRRPDGYHTVEMVMQTIDLTDRITAEKTAGDLTLAVSGAALPTDESNTVMCAAKRYCEIAAVPPHFHLTVQKNIPLQAGLAGGSADAAGALIALNALCGNRLSHRDLCEIGAAVGADVPFCLTGGTALATGIGTLLSPLPPLPDCRMAVLKPFIGISTADAYRAIDTATFVPQTADAMLRALTEADLIAVGREMMNRFAQMLPVPAITQLSEGLLSAGALGACMTGSGSAVIGLFTEEKAAATAVAALQSQCAQTAVCCPWRGGPRIVSVE